MELKACECGGEARVWVDEADYFMPDEYIVECKKCGKKTRNYLSKYAAISAWNTRREEGKVEG